MRWSDIAVRKKLYAVFVVGIGFFISIMVLILSFLYDVGEDAELLGRPRNDTELLTAEVGHLQWAMSVQDYVMNEGRIPLEAALDGRRCVFGTWFYGPNRTALEQEVPDLRPLFAVLDQKHLALHQSAGVIRTDMERGESAAAKEHFRTVSLPLLTEVRDLLRNSLALTRGAQSGIVARLEGKLNDITRMAVSASLIFLLAGLTIAVLLVRRICGPLGRLTAAARRVAEGDFMTVDIAQKDEVGQLASRRRAPDAFLPDSVRRKGRHRLRGHPEQFCRSEETPGHGRLPPAGSRRTHGGSVHPA